MIIAHLEDAYRAYEDNDSECCDKSLRQAELLMPDSSDYDEIAEALDNHIRKLRDCLDSKCGSGPS